MRYLKTRNPRKGAVLVENAIVLLILITFIIGILVGGLGVFRYQQIAMLAREGARFACVRGTDSGTPYTTAQVEKVITDMAAGLDLNELKISVTPATGQSPATADPNSNPPGMPIGTTVEVNVSYKWIPEAFFGGATMTSKSVMPMHY